MSPRRVVLLALPLLFALVLLGAVRATSGFERRIASDQAEAARVITYVADPGVPIHVPLQPGAEVVRVVAHAYRRGPLAASPHPAKLSATVQAHTQMLAFDAPGTVTRASAEDGDVTVGDPVALNFDVRAGGAGEITLVLDAIEGADGLLVRAYQRESLGVMEALRRRSALSAARREHVARRAGEPDWLDLESSERAALIASRWTKLAALADSDRGVETRAVSLQPPALDRRAPVPPPPRPVEGRPVAYYRATPERPVVVTAGPESLVLRVSARRALQRSLRGDVPLAVVGAFDGPGHEGVTSTFRTTVVPSASDRYSAPGSELTPSERAVFYVLVPGSGRATLRPEEGAVDLSLSELDPVPSPRSPSPPSEGDAPEAERGGAPVFRFRRPSNAGDFGVDAQGVVLVAPAPRTRTPPEPPSKRSGLTRVVRPHAAGILRRDGRVFEPAAVHFSVPVGGSEPVVLTARLVSDARTEVVATLDGGKPRRRWAGIVKRLTTQRTIPTDREARAVIVLGDDLEPGGHDLAFVATPAAPVWVHLPWVHRGRGPVRESTWIAGDFAP